MTRRKPNPAVGYAEDMFAPIGALTPVVRELSEMTEEEILSLPRSAFSDKEWGQLDEDLQAQIVEGDLTRPESKARVAKMIKEFVSRHEGATEFQDHMRDPIQEDIDNEIAALDQTSVQRLRRRYTEIDSLFDTFEAYSKEQIEDAVLEALQDNNNYDYTWNTDEYGSAFFKGQYNDSFYIDGSDLEDLLEGMSEIEIEAAIEEINNDTYLNLKRKDLDVKYEFHIDDYSTFYGDADPDWDKVAEAVKDLLEDKDPEGKGEPSIDPEERKLYTLADGSYVIDLLASELPGETKMLKHCVGRSDQGYIRAVKEGRTRIWSWRSPDGFSRFTFEVRLKPDASIDYVASIKGHLNRLPGWDEPPYHAGGDVWKVRGKWIPDEVQDILEILRVLKIPHVKKIRDIKPALRHMKGLPPFGGELRENPSDGHCGFCCPVDQ